MTKPRPLAVIRNRRLNSVALLDPLRSVQFSASWTRALRRPGIPHRHLPCHAMPYHTTPCQSQTSLFSIYDGVHFFHEPTLPYKSALVSHTAFHERTWTWAKPLHFFFMLLFHFIHHTFCPDREAFHASVKKFQFCMGAISGHH